MPRQKIQPPGYERDPASRLRTRGCFPGHLSEELKDLLCQMLAVDCVRRITIPQIYEHPWFVQSLPIYLSGAFPNSPNAVPEVSVRRLHQRCLEQQRDKYGGNSMYGGAWGYCKEEGEERRRREEKLAKAAREVELQEKGFIPKRGPPPVVELSQERGPSERRGPPPVEELSQERGPSERRGPPPVVEVSARRGMLRSTNAGNVAAPPREERREECCGSSEGGAAPEVGRTTRTPSEEQQVPTEEEQGLGRNIPVRGNAGCSSAS